MVLLRGLGEVCPMDELPTLLRLVAAEDPSPLVRLNAALAVHTLPQAGVADHFGPNPDEDALVAALTAGEGLAGIGAVSALARLPEGRPGVVLARALEAGISEAWTLGAVARALGRHGGPGAPEEAAALLDHPSPRVGANALLSLAELEPSAGLFAATYRLDSRDHRMRASALRVVHVTNPDIATAHLRAMATSSAVWMRAAARDLLDDLELPDRGELLLEISYREDGYELLLSVLRSLATWVDPRAQGALAYWAHAGGEALKTRARSLIEQVAPGASDEQLQPLAWAYESARAQVRMGFEPAMPRSEDLVATGSAPLERFLAEVSGMKAFLPSELEEARAEAAADSGGAFDGDLEEAVKLTMSDLEEGRAEVAIRRLQSFLPEEGGPVSPLLRWALALAFAENGDLGLAVNHVDRLDLDQLSLSRVYMLGRQLEAVGVLSVALKVFENVRARRLGYQDVEKRLSGLARLSAEVPEEIWRTLGARYQRLHVLGRGGMGQVFEAVERDTERKVAVKVPNQLSLRDPVLMSRFQNEMETVAAIDHPNVVKVYEISGGAVPYYSMELVRGESLEDRIDREGKLEPAEAVQVLLPIASALAFVHGLGLLHRDIKPSNVLLGQDGVSRLTDFGLVYDHVVSGGLTRSGEVIGTLNYLAPEVLTGGKPSPSSDVYGFGTLLYEVIAGGPPYPSEQATMRLYRDPPALRKTVPDVPERLEALVAACLSRDPSRRPANGSVLAKQLADQ